MAAMIPVLNMKVKDLPVLAAFCAPLVVTSAVPLPQLTAVGIAANLLITRMTVRALRGRGSGSDLTRAADGGREREGHWEEGKAGSEASILAARPRN